MVWVARAGGYRLNTTGRRRLGEAAIALLLSLLVSACWGEETQPEPRPSTHTARLSQLGLTTEISRRT
jgi:hypothetical protein